MKLAHLECLIMRGMDEKIPVVAREIAQTLYLDDDNKSMVQDHLATPTQIQLVSMFQAAPAEVQDAVQVFRDQLIKKQEEDAITDFINIKKPKLDVD
jgi:hypothetical protein